METYGASDGAVLEPVNGGDTDVVVAIVNYDQSFEYDIEPGSYFRPRSVQDIIDVITHTRNVSQPQQQQQQTIRVMGSANSSAYVYTDDILIDMHEFPFDPVLNIDMATVTVNVSMSIRALNEWLMPRGYVLRGAPTSDEITIGGAFGSCSIGPLYDGLSIAHYMVEATLVDAAGQVQTYDGSDSLQGVYYLDAIRCNLGLLGVLVQVTLQVFELQFVHRMEYLYPAQHYDDNDWNEMDSEQLWNDTYWRFEDAENFDRVLGKELFIDPYSNRFVWTVWSDRNTSNDDADDDAADVFSSYSPASYANDEAIFNEIVTPLSCIFPQMFDFAIDAFIENGRYYKNPNAAPLLYALQKPNYVVWRSAYIVPQAVCVSAILDAIELANTLENEVRMLPIGVTYINAPPQNRRSILGYDATDSCMIEIQINKCSTSLTMFSEEFEHIIVSKYNGTGHWAYLWHDYTQWFNTPSQQAALSQFEVIRSALDPNGTFTNALYLNLYKNPNERDAIVSPFVSKTFPCNVKINRVNFFVIAAWFAFVFVLYLIGSYYRILPFLDARDLCDYCGVGSLDEENKERVKVCGVDLKCCDDLNELDELIEKEQHLLEQYAHEDNYEKVVEDLIDIEVLDPISGDYITVTVTFRTAFYILMGDENYREWKHREKFAVSREEELIERYEKLGEELTWISIYPRQCLFFSASVLSIALIVVAVIEASLN